MSRLVRADFWTIIHAKNLYLFTFFFIIIIIYLKLYE